MAIWMGGSNETAPDVSLLVSRLPRGAEQWTAPEVLTDVPGHSMGQPVLLRQPDRELWLFYNVIQEVSWETAIPYLMRSTDGEYTWGAPTVAFFIALFLSMFLLSQALKSLPVGTAYAVWTGIGAAGTAILGMLVLGESRDVLKLLSLLMLVGGIIGLRVASSQHPPESGYVPGSCGRSSPPECAPGS